MDFRREDHRVFTSVDGGLEGLRHLGLFYYYARTVIHSIYAEYVMCVS